MHYSVAYFLSVLQSARFNSPRQVRRYWKVTHRHLAFFLSLLVALSPVAAIQARSNTLWQEQSSQERIDVRRQAKDEDELTLELDKPVKRELKASQTHSYRIPVTSGHSLRAVIEQQGIDVVATLFARNGKKIAEVDNQSGPLGREIVSVVADESGDYRLEVRARSEKADTGHYEIAIEERREAGPEERGVMEVGPSRVGMPLFAQRGIERVSNEPKVPVTPQSRTLVAQVEFGLSDHFSVGSMVMVKVIDPTLANRAASGTIRIISASTGFDTGPKSLTFAADGGTLYYRWPTSGLPPATDYLIRATINDNAGQWIDQIQIILGPHVTELVKVLAKTEDLYLPFMDFGLHLTRTYRYDSSYYPYKGPFGFGWTHEFGAKLTETTDGYISFFASDGSSSYYRSTGGGVYESSPGDRSRLTRDPNGTFQLRVANGESWRFRNDLTLDAFSDRNGNKVSCSYDPQNRLASLSVASGQAILFTYDSDGRITRATDSTGRAVNYDYDPAGNLQQVTDAIGNITTFLYDGQHRLTQIAAPDGRHQFFSYNADGRLQRIAADKGASAVDFSYDTTTGEQTITDAVGRLTKVRTNEAERVTEFRDGLGNISRFQYDSNFNLTRVTDGNGNSRQIVPDVRGNPAQVIDPLGHQLSSIHSTDFNQLTSLTDENGNQTLFEYDETGDPTKKIYVDGSTETNAITDQSGTRTIERKLRSGQTITYVYNDRGLLTSKLLPGGLLNTFNYDSRGNLTSASNAEGTITFEYDVLSRLTKAIYPGNRSFGYTYNQMSRLATMTDPDRRQLGYSYDDAGNLETIYAVKKRGDLSADRLGRDLVRYNYNLAGQPVLRILANGVRTEYSYDGASRVTTIVNRKSAGDVISSWTYGYDAAGNRTKKIGPEGEETYTYDRNSQLTAVRYADGTTESFEYDPAGNRSAVITNGARKDYTRNSLNQYTAAGSETFQYDLNGNLIFKNDGSGQTTLYEYDAENRLTRAQLPTAEAISYTYDALGRLSSRTDSNGANHFLWDRGQIAIEESAARTTVAQYTWGGTLDEALSMRRGGQDFFYNQDALRNVTELTDVAGNLAEAYRYRAFGEPTTAISLGNPFLFTGAFYDSKPGLFTLRFRSYSPTLGRFMQPDPIGMAGGTNLYSYVRNNPVNRLDPYGLRWSFLDIFVGIVVVVTLAFLVAPLFEAGALGTSLFLGGAKLIEWGEPLLHDPMLTIDMLHAARERIVEVIGSGSEGHGGGNCPTFIQPPLESASSPQHVDVGKEQLAGKIAVPVNNALLRSDIPIFGVAGGKQFKEYRVEYGEGKSPTQWHLLSSSTTPQPKNDVGIAEMKLMQGDIDIRGNLATWNTGLKEWVHLPWHPADDPTDFNGTYTIRLVVTGKDGKTVEDRVTCEVGRVIAQVLPGKAISTDKKVTMDFQAQSIQSAFRVYTIKPLTVGIPDLPKDQELIGSVYTIREPGDRFLKPVVLRFNVGAETRNRKSSQLGIFAFDPKTRRWDLLPTVPGREPGTLETSISRLPETAAHYAVMAGKTNQLQLPPTTSAVRIPASANQDEAILVFNTFEKDAGEWAGRDAEFGATVTRDLTATPNGSYALRITNENFGGNFGATVLANPFRADIYSLVSFDYKINPGVKTDFYVRAGPTWYNVGFTDDENDFKNKDVGISRIGKVEGVIADGKWHSASFDLDRLLANKTGHRVVDEIIMADWDVGGYMKLDFGRNARGATFYVDNFKIRRGTESRRASAQPGGELLVDDFDAARGVNLLGGPSDVFSAPGTYSCVMSFVPSGARGRPQAGSDGAASSEHALSLKYDSTRQNSYSGWWSQLHGSSIEEFDRLALKLKVVSGSTNFTVGLKNSKGVEVRVPANDYLGKADRAGWQELVVPLTAFKAIGDRSSMAVCSIAFTEEGRSGKGEILIDDVKFQKGPLNYLRVADFEGSQPDTNLLMQKNWTFMHGAAAIANNLDGSRASKPAEHCLRLSFGGSVGLDLGGGDFSYAAWVTSLGGIDASANTFLRLKIKGQDGGEKPNIYLADGTTRRGVDLRKYTSVTTDWQDVYIPLQDFVRQGVDLTHLEELQFVFEWEPMSGTIYLDDISFSKDKVVSEVPRNK